MPPVIPTETGEFVSVPARVTEATAAMPSVMVVMFMPKARHVIEPPVPLHITVFPASVRTGPADTVMEVIAAGL
jgi:hypothetical protein